MVSQPDTGCLDRIRPTIIGHTVCHQEIKLSSPATITSQHLPLRQHPNNPDTSSLVFESLNESIIATYFDLLRYLETASHNQYHRHWIWCIKEGDLSCPQRPLALLCCGLAPQPLSWSCTRMAWDGRWSTPASASTRGWCSGTRWPGHCSSSIPDIMRDDK